MKQFSCGDVVPGCKAVFQAEDESGILTQVANHARNDHGMTTVPGDVIQQVRNHIREAPAA